MPYRKQKAIRSNKKDVIYDLMTDLGSSQNRTQHHEADGGKQRTLTNKERLAA